MSTTTLQPFERQALALLLSPSNCSDAAIRHQCESVSVIRRENTCVGMFIYLDVLDEFSSKTLERKTISNLCGSMDQLSNGFGGIVFIENGKLNILEFFTYDEPWPDNPTGIKMWLLE